MIKYYSSLLNSALKATANGRSMRRKAFSCCTAGHDDPGIFLPDALLPDGMENQTLPSGPHFIDNAIECVEQHIPDALFICPPLNQMRDEVWSGRFGKRDIAQVTSALLFDLDLLEERSARQGNDDMSLLFAQRDPKPIERIDPLIMLLPARAIYDYRCRSWRDLLLQRHSVTFIDHAHGGVAETLGLPQRLNFRFFTLIIQRRPGPTRFFKITDEVCAMKADVIADDLEALLGLSSGRTAFGYVHTSPIDIDDPCLFDAYSPETKSLEQQITGSEPPVLLGSVAKILSHGFVPAGNHALHHAPPAEAGFQYMHPRCIHPSGHIDLSALRAQDRPSHIKHLLQDGDICLSRLVCRENRFYAGIFRSNGNPVTFAPSILVIRMGEKATDTMRNALLNHLRSPLFYRLAAAKGAVFTGIDLPHVSSSKLKHLPVPTLLREIEDCSWQLKYQAKKSSASNDLPGTGE